MLLLKQRRLRKLIRGDILLKIIEAGADVSNFGGKKKPGKIELFLKVLNHQSIKK